MENPSEIQSQILTADKAFKLNACTVYVCTIADAGSSGAAKLQRWDGLAWKDCADSDGTTSQVFTFTTPPTGRINFNLTAGQVRVACKPLAPTLIRNS